MKPEPNDEFELQPSAHEPKPSERGPVPPKIKPDPDWATHQPLDPTHPTHPHQPHQGPAQGGGVGLGRATPGRGNAVLGGANARATPGRGVPNYANIPARMTPGRGTALPARMTPQFGTPHLEDGTAAPRRRTTGAHIYSEPELQPSEAPHPAIGPDGVPVDGPPPSTKVDFENLPEFVWQRKMLRTVKMAAAGAGALLVAIVLYFALRAGKSTVKPIVDELEKKNDGAELLKDDRPK